MGERDGSGHEGEAEGGGLGVVLRERLARLFGDLRGRDLRWLLRPRHHPALVARQRAKMIISRVRWVAILFAVLTPLWIVIDVAVFAWPLWGKLAVARLITSAAFVALAVVFRASFRMRDAWLAMAVMFAIPTLFFLYSHPLLAGHAMESMASAIASGYAFLPFVMLTGLAVFPLTAVEGVIFALPVLAAEAGVAAMQLDMLGWTSHMGAFWLLLLIAVVATLASMSQLHFMAALVRQSSKDPLTGALNRRSGEELLELQFDLAARHGQPLAVAFIDLDHFKAINDVYGHDSGDAILIQAADAVRSALRRSDIAVRWGGEEFLVVMPHTDCRGVVHALHRLCRQGLGPRPDGAALTASLGMAERLADQTPDWRALVDRADHRMYQSKTEGGARLTGCCGAFHCLQVAAGFQAHTHRSTCSPPRREVGA
jgi:diguanylate cyclase (GGDEF)-like protein